MWRVAYFEGMFGIISSQNPTVRLGSNRQSVWAMLPGAEAPLQGMKHGSPACQGNWMHFAYNGTRGAGASLRTSRLCTAHVPGVRAQCQPVCRDSQ